MSIEVYKSPALSVAFVLLDRLPELYYNCMTKRDLQCVVPSHLATIFHDIDKWFQHNFDHALLQGVALGVIAFAIPVLWSTAGEIRNALERTTEKLPIGIINRVYYQRTGKYFTLFVMLPSVVLAFLGLTIFPVLPSPYGVLGMKMI